MAQTAPDARRIVEDYAELWNERDYENISDVVSESFVHTTPALPDGEARGPEGVETFMREVTTGFPDFEVRTVDVLSRDDVAMAENEFSMTHEGEFNGIPPTGKELQVRSMMTCRIEDGKLQELREYIDMLAVFEKLGVMDVEPPA